MILTLQTLASATGAGIVRAQSWLAYLQQALDAFEITTPARAAAFLAQIGHESAGLRFTTEIWNPAQVPAQARYEGRADLGNTQPGDGFKFRGHGLIQVTGRANHAAARDHLRVKCGTRVPDFEQEPHRLAEPEWAALSAADFWARKGLNELADAGNFEQITRRINGGTNGLADRLARFAVAKNVLGA
ncbi:glycoside hydrolase family 19 protein [Ramlibacter monticola]|uniref:Glycoside hydrolase family 19 protein n=1 Tax=Ramlibacter monticola TaxID=1926872 RepID=A0A937CSG3_9BURK|nr:glycoside hydrolase family 19 protein [Ramlibacter monticola]MBL0390544.1 glycoside hydrolase family 19 protein [Ramlibacter monticola]